MATVKKEKTITFQARHVTVKKRTSVYRTLHYESSLEGEPRARAERSARDRARHRRQGDKHWSRVPAARARDDPENVSSYPHLAGYRCTGRAPREKANIVMARFKHTVTTYLRSRSQVML